MKATDGVNQAAARIVREATTCSLSGQYYLFRSSCMNRLVLEKRVQVVAALVKGAASIPSSANDPTLPLGRMLPYRSLLP